MSNLAAGVIIVGLVYLAILLPLGRLTAAQVGAFTIAFVTGALVISVVVPNTSSISHLIAKAGNLLSLSVDMQQAVTQVHTDTTENKQIRTEIQTLVRQVSDAKAEVSTSEQNVSQMQANVRQAYRTLFDVLTYSLLTRNVLTPPAQLEILRRLDSLAVVAYPDPQERAKVIQSLVAEAQAMQANPYGSPTIRPTP